MLSDAFKLRPLASSLALESSATTGITSTTIFDRHTQGKTAVHSSFSSVSNSAYPARNSHIKSSATSELNATLKGLGGRSDTRTFASGAFDLEESSTRSAWFRRVTAVEQRSLVAGTYAVQVDYSSSNLGNESVINNATPAIATGQTLADASPLGAVSSPQTISGFVGTTAADNYYRFTLSTTSNLSVSLSNLTADADLQLIQDTNQNGVVDAGEVIGSSSNPSAQPESIATGLAAGTYVIHVYQYSGDTNYTLNASATPLPIPVGYDTDYGYGLADAGAALTSLVGQSPQTIPDLSSNAWNLNLVGAPVAWAQGYTGQGVVVAVVDTGVDATHSDLKDNIWTNPREISGNGIDDDGNGFVDDVHGWDFVDRDNTPTDLNGHGTHVAGTIAAKQNGFGVTGVAYNATIMPIRVIGPDSGSNLDVAAGIRYAADNGANVINLSLGGSASSAIADAVKYATQEGSLVVMAAGNDGGSQPIFPANLANQWGVAVGAIDINKKLADFSDRAGAIPLNYVVAPGVNIVSTTPNNTYQSLSGTSMATPHVSGVAALLLSANPKLTPTQITSLLTTDATTQGLTVA